MSLRIFLQSLHRVIDDNLKGALQVSGFILLLQFIWSVVLMPSVLNENEIVDIVMDGGSPQTRMGISVLVSAVLWFWLMFHWHRYLQLNERPKFVPAIQTDRLIDYAVKYILILLMLLPLLFVLGFVGGSIGMAMDGGGLFAMLLILLIIVVPAMTAWMVLASILPGVAVKGGVPLLSGWKAMRGEIVAVLGTVGLLVGAVAVLQMIGSLILGGPTWIIGRIYYLAVVWLAVLVAASILNTLYNHYIEGKPLEA